MAIVVYDTPPIPHNPKYTRFVEAGAVKFGLEYRTLDNAELAREYADDLESLAKLDAVTPPELEDRGVSIHVIGAEDEHEYVRFDVFDNGPHYHYIKKGVVENKVVDFDPVAMGEMLPWALTQIRDKLSVMVDHAGGSDLAARLDTGLLAEKVEELRTLAQQALRERKGAR